MTDKLSILEHFTIDDIELLESTLKTLKHKKLLNDITLQLKADADTKLNSIANHIIVTNYIADNENYIVTIEIDKLHIKYKNQDTIKLELSSPNYSITALPTYEYFKFYETEKIFNNIELENLSADLNISKDILLAICDLVLINI
jgi:hypothetical protein